MALPSTLWYPDIFQLRVLQLSDCAWTIPQEVGAHRTALQPCRVLESDAQPQLLSGPPGR
jgi:hypothetical protein